MLNVSLAHAKLATYYAKLDDAPVYYAATVLHPQYKHHFEALQNVPDVIWMYLCLVPTRSQAQTVYTLAGGWILPEGPPKS